MTLGKISRFFSRSLNGRCSHLGFRAIVSKSLLIDQWSPNTVEMLRLLTRTWCVVAQRVILEMAVYDISDFGKTLAVFPVQPIITQIAGNVAPWIRLCGTYVWRWKCIATKQWGALAMLEFLLFDYSSPNLVELLRLRIRQVLLLDQFYCA